LTAGSVRAASTGTKGGSDKAGQATEVWNKAPFTTGYLKKVKNGSMAVCKKK
jgi:hypothetical protein